MYKRAARVFGIVLLLVGLLGFIPPLAPHGYLFGLFEVDALHNLLHLVTGGAGVLVAFVGGRAGQGYFRVVGIIYGLLTVLGFFHGNAPLFGVMAHNQADIGLHLVIALYTLYMGFVVRTTPPEPV